MLSRDILRVIASGAVLLTVGCFPPPYRVGHVALTGKVVNEQLLFEFIRCGSRAVRESQIQSVSLKKKGRDGD